MSPTPHADCILEQTRRPRYSRCPRTLIVGLASLICVFLVQAAFARQAPDQKVVAHRRIAYGGDVAFRPFEWIDRDGKAKGFQIDLIRAIAKDRGWDLTVRLDTWSRIREQLTSGEIDLVSMFARESRTSFASFSEPFATEYGELFVRAGTTGIDSLDDLRGKTVIVEQGALAMDELPAMGITPTFVQVNTENEAIRLLASGLHDAAIATHFGGRFAMQEGQIDNVVGVGPPILRSQCCFAVKKGNEALLAEINAGLRAVRASGEFAVIYDRWFHESERPSLSVAQALKWTLATMAGLVLLASAVIAHNRILRQRVVSRTRELENELAERRRVESALRDSDARFRVALQGSSIMVANQDRRLRYTWVYNPHAALGGGDLIGKTDADVFAAPLAARVADVKSHVLATGERAHLEFTLPTAQGERHFELEVEPLRPEPGSAGGEAEGEPVGVTSAAMDITEVKLAEERRLALERRVRQAQKLESLGLLAGGVAHDFNNLLSGIMGHASLLKGDVPELSPAHEHASTIEQAARRAAELTQQLLAYSGHAATVPQPVNLNDVCTEMSRLLKGSLPGGVEARLDLFFALPLVQGDATQVRQVTMNLIKNAAESMLGRGGELVVRTRRTRLGESRIERAEVGTNAEPGEYASIEVADSGRGVDADSRPRLFDPFFTTKPNGKGLGLAVVAGIARRHRGVIEVDSTAGRGSTFRVHFPLPATTIQDFSDRPPVILTETGPDSGTTGWKTALVIEDNATVRDVLVKSLERAGIAVLTAEDGLSGLERFEKSRGGIDAIVLDLNLPLLDGLSVYKRVRALSREVAVVMASGVDDHEAVDALRGDPRATFLQKPFLPDELIRTVRGVLARAV